MGIKAGQEWTKDKLNLQEVNLLANGGFDYNTPGVTSISNIANGARTPFLNWFFKKSGSTPPTVNVSVETSTKRTNSRQSCKVAITTAGSSDAVCGVSQLIYNFEEFKGLKISLRIYANASSASRLRAYIDDGVTKTYSGYHPGNSIWSALDVENVTISTSATKLEVGVEYVASSADTFYVDNAMLVPGDVAVDYTGFDFIKNGDDALTLYLKKDGSVAITNNWDVDGAQTLYIDKTNGRIGVRTSSPNARLHIFGDESPIPLRITHTGTTGFIHPYKVSCPNAQTGAHIVLAEGGILEGNCGTGYISFWLYSDTPSQRAVSIGLWGVDDVLVVTGNRTVHVNQYTGSGVFNVRGISGYKTTAWITSQNGDIYTDWPAEWGGGIATGDICCASINYSGLRQRSDISLKENIRYLDKERVIDKVIQLKPISFQWKDKRLEKGKNYGLIGEEVEQVFPELVISDSEGKKGIKTSDLIFILLKAIQELKEEIDMLKQRAM
jgi:hypothetical protein